MSQVFVVSCLLVNVFARAAPVVDLKLAPAAAALPDILSQIAGLEAARVDAEEASLARLDAAYEAAASDAEAKIQSLFTKAFLSGGGSAKVIAASFLGARGVDFRVGISPAPPVKNRIRKQIALIERIRGVEESRLVDQAVAEFQMLVDVLVNDLKSGLLRASGRGIAFLDTGPAAEPVAADIRLLPPDEPFPTVAGLVADMEERRDVAEDRLRQRILDLDLQLVKHMKAIVSAALA